MPTLDSLCVRRRLAPSVVANEGHTLPVFSKLGKYGEQWLPKIRNNSWCIVFNTFKYFRTDMNPSSFWLKILSALFSHNPPAIWASVINTFSDANRSCFVAKYPESFSYLNFSSMFSGFHPSLRYFFNMRFHDFFKSE